MYVSLPDRVVALSGRPDLGRVLVDPLAEDARRQCIGKDEDGRTLHVVIDDGRLDATTFGQ